MFNPEDFVRSSFCKADSPQCVLAKRDSTDKIVVGDSKSGQTLEFTDAEWKAFISGAKNGEFDF